jgi:DNA-binding ferritin-like protein (Dps family)
MTTEKARELREDITAARKILSELCHGTHKWRMCVPVQEDDSDSVLGRVIDAAERSMNTPAAPEDVALAIKNVRNFVTECREYAEWPDEVPRIFTGDIELLITAATSAQGVQAVTVEEFSKILDKLLDDYNEWFEQAIFQDGHLPDYVKDRGKYVIQRLSECGLKIIRKE